MNVRNRWGKTRSRSSPIRGRKTLATRDPMRDDLVEIQSLPLLTSRNLLTQRRRSDGGERRHRDKQDRSKDAKHRARRPAHQLDIIDKLDVTGIYGSGCKQQTTILPSLTRSPNLLHLRKSNIPSRC